MPEPLELNDELQGRKIQSVEPGTTPGWMVINLELKPEEHEAEPEMRLFLTVFIGGRKGPSEASYSSTSALHYKGADGRSTVHAIRDERDPDMPMSSAHTVLGDARLGVESEPSDVKELKSEERTLQSAKTQEETSNDDVE